jgi:Leucine-rich repeat (LRR) protein
MEIKDSALKQILQEYHDSDKEEFSKYEMSVIKEIYLDNDSDIDANLIDLKYFTYLEKVVIRDLFVNREMLNNICRLKNLRKVNFYNCNISDLRILVEANLCELVIDGCEFEDIVVLNSMDCLEDLYLDNNTVVDLKDLVIIRRLKKLSLSNVKVENPEQFIYMNEIESLRIDGSGVKDITPLLSMDKLKLLVIDKEQAIYNKKYINEFKDKGINVVDYMNRDVEVYYG